MFNIPLLESVSPTASSRWPDLAQVLGRLPATTCRRKTACCALLPQMTLLEAARLMDRVKSMDPGDQHPFLLRMASYFHLNATRIMGCPFLSDHMCIVYHERPFGCRAYGLWSPQTYREQTRAASQGQKAVQQAWASMGISLPRDVVEHQPPYCRDITLEGEGSITDLELQAVEKDVQALNHELGSSCLDFNRHFYADLSFLVAASFWGVETALKNKVSVVREYTSTGRSPSLEYLMEKMGGAL